MQQADGLQPIDASSTGAATGEVIGDEDKTEGIPNNFEAQFPELVQELEGLAEDAGQDLPEEAKQTLADLKRKRYTDFLEEGHAEQELAGKERA